MTTKYTVIKEKFALRLKSLMIEFNETTYSLADIVHLSAATISRYSDGKMAPKITTITLLAEHFNVNPVWLMGYDVEKNMLQKTNFNNISEQEKELLSKYNKLNETGKSEALKRVTELTEISRYLIDYETVTTKDDYLMPVAAHDDELTGDEKDFMQKCIEEYEKNK